MLIGGLLLRQGYRSAVLARIPVTVGVVCILLPYLIPEQGKLPLVMLFDMLADMPGKGKVVPILFLVPIVVALLSLLAWIPGPSSAAAKIFAWIMIVWPVVAALVTLLIGGDIGAHIKADMHGVFWVPIASMGWLAFAGYGLASVVGKSLEHG